MRTISAAFAAMALTAACGSPPPTDITGHWDGSISVAGTVLGIAVDFAGAAESLTGTIDIPVQNARGIPLDSVVISGDSLSFILIAGPGVATFKGVVSDSSIAGSFEQAGYAGSFDLRRQETRSYVMTEVSLPGDGFVLTGTLSIPSETATGLPGIVLLTGSGLQDRDENVFGFKVFDVMADFLTSQGFAVLRCDDRGVGGSTGPIQDLTDSILALDAALMLDFLRSRPEVDSTRVGLLGHSEGSNVAFLATAANPGKVAFVISMAGPSVPGYDILLGQVGALSRAAGRTEEQTTEMLALQKSIMDSIIAGGSLDSLRPMIEHQIRDGVDAMTEEERQALGDVEGFISQGMDQTMSTVQSPWFRKFLITDPADYAALVSCPVLALYGSLDVQVPPDMNEGPMREALAGNPLSRVIVIDGANHLFQAAVNGSIDEYSTLEPEFLPGFQDSITAWLGTVIDGAAPPE